MTLMCFATGSIMLTGSLQCILSELQNISLVLKTKQECQNAILPFVVVYSLCIMLFWFTCM